MDKVKINKITEVKEIVDDLHLTNIVIETGKENAFIPQENKFILTENITSNVQNLLQLCNSIINVDLTNFKFDNVKTMQGWFAYCENLNNITFPKVVYCNKLTNMVTTFRNTKIKHFDFTNWIFFQDLRLDSTFSNSDCETIKFGNINMSNMLFTFNFCTKLQKVNFGNTHFTISTYKDLSKTLCAFKKCESLKLINASNFTVEAETVPIEDVFTNNNVLLGCNENCVIVLPNEY